VDVNTNSKKVRVTDSNKIESIAGKCGVRFALHVGFKITIE
jgi:hypothetical protein